MTASTGGSAALAPAEQPVSVLSPYTSRAAALTSLTRHLTGRGLELGPGHHPLPLPLAGAEVRYVDRWQPAENRELFDELGAKAEFAEPDVVANLATERLSKFPDASEDFVIASHLLEHLPEPLGLLVDIHRVLRPGGTLLLLLPDRRRTFDAGRPATSLEHLLADFAAGATEPEDAHVAEFLAAIGQLEDWDADERSRRFDLHRRRSIHVHCWTEDEFAEVLLHSIAELGSSWELTDALLASEVGDSLEFGFVLRRALAPLPAPTAARRFAACWAAHRERVSDLLAAGDYLDALRRDAERTREADARTNAEYVAAVEREREALRAVVAHQDAQLAVLRRGPLLPVARAVWRARERMVARRR